MTSWQLVWIIGLMQGGGIVVMLICAWALAQTCWKAQKLHAEAENRLLAISEKLLMSGMAAGTGAQPELAGRALEDNRSTVDAVRRAPVDPSLLMHSGLPIDPPGVYVGAGS